MIPGMTCTGTVVLLRGNMQTVVETSVPASRTQGKASLKSLIPNSGDHIAITFG